MCTVISIMACCVSILRVCPFGIAPALRYVLELKFVNRLKFFLLFFILNLKQKYNDSKGDLWFIYSSSFKNFLELWVWTASRNPWIFWSWSHARQNYVTSLDVLNHYGALLQWSKRYEFFCFSPNILTCQNELLSWEPKFSNTVAY